MIKSILLTLLSTVATACIAATPDPYEVSEATQNICTIDDPDCAPGTMFNPGWDANDAATAAQQPVSSIRTQGCVSYNNGSTMQAHCEFSFGFGIIVDCFTDYTSDENGVRIESGSCGVRGCDANHC